MIPFVLTLYTFNSEVRISTHTGKFYFLLFLKQVIAAKICAYGCHDLFYFRTSDTALIYCLQKHGSASKK